MSAIIVLIICSLLVSLAFLGAFILSVRSGQYDDDYTPSVRMLFDQQQGPSEEPDSAEKSEKTNK